MQTKLLSACAATALALTAALAILPNGSARATKGDLDCHQLCGPATGHATVTTSQQVGASTTVLVKWNGMVASR